MSAEENCPKLTDWYYTVPVCSGICCCEYYDDATDYPCRYCNDNWSDNIVHTGDHVGCILDCRMCQCEPEILVHLLTGQKQMLRNVLKDLWTNIDIVLGPWRGNRRNKRRRIEEMYLLLTECKFTRCYLDWDRGFKGWSASLLDTVKNLRERRNSRSCSCSGIDVCDDCWEQMERENKKRKRK